MFEQPELKVGEGPVALVLSPTRELCQQIFNVFDKFCRRFGVGVIPLFGGVNVEQVWKDIKSKHNKNHIVVATPGKLIDFIKKNAFSLQSRCSIVVLDEADTMLSLGFEK